MIEVSSHRLLVNIILHYKDTCAFISTEEFYDDQHRVYVIGDVESIEPEYRLDIPDVLERLDLEVLEVGRHYLLRGSLLTPTEL